MAESELNPETDKVFEQVDDIFLAPGEKEKYHNIVEYFATAPMIAEFTLTASRILYYLWLAKKYAKEMDEPSDEIGGMAIMGLCIMQDEEKKKNEKSAGI